MNTPIPVSPAPVPQTPPTAAGVVQGLLTAWLTFKGGQKLGLDPTSAIVLAGGVTSAITSAFHQLAQKWHLSN